MFRKPRETSPNDSQTVISSVGRPPTPPTTPAKTPFTLAVTPSVPPPRMAVTNSRSSRSTPLPLPTIGRQGLVGSTKKPASAIKIKDKGNGNIMSFFRKAEEEMGLFVEEKGRRGSSSQSLPSGAQEELHNDSITATSPVWNDERRFNEATGSVKRQRMDGSMKEDESGIDESRRRSNVNDERLHTSQDRIGPFIEDSDSDQEGEVPEAILSIGEEASISGDTAEMHAEVNPEQLEIAIGQMKDAEAADNLRERPPLIKEETSFGPDLDDFKDFEELEDFEDDPYEDGDEYMERRYMEEQAQIEAEEEQKNGPSLPATEAARCPICNIGLSGVSEQEAGIHVNNCLDGNPTPLPERKGSASPPVKIKEESGIVTSATQFRRPNRAPKPGQANPFSFGQSTTNGGSAFNKLMSGHAESAAWAEAAAAEHASRGKPSYQRTCPFYKILPGLYICVDAFRYGAVQECKAYFLSHFHSDHYVGLTSHWCHGPIYCSKVTANLVRQQLRVDPQYVVPLEFEETIEVPGTRGVQVTMISANHCPGSSLFLFEKKVGKKQNGDIKLQRILHCGDFRACRMHVEHPLLMPEVQDKVSGKMQEQKIDVCYLDTTYLTPKYAFPSQAAVIKACADMCVSLSKHTVDETDGWEQMKRQRAGEGMAKFIRKESNTDIKEEPTEDGPADGFELSKHPAASQQVITTSATPNVEKGRGRLLVIVGTYSIGKERICLGIAKALGSKIYAPPSKQRIVAALEDPELDALMTPDPKAAQVHMTPLFEIRADTLDDYLKDYFPHFTRAVGFRPSGWNYRPPNSRFTDSPTVQTVLHSDNWKSTFSMRDLVPQRGSSSRASCFGVPYSEHSSFRELTMFCCALRIDKIIPTVNVGSAKSRERMKAWCERWAAERRKNGLYVLPGDGSW